MNSSTNGKHYLVAINVLFQAASSLARKHSLKLCLYTEVSRGHPKVSGCLKLGLFKTLRLAGEGSAGLNSVEEVGRKCESILDFYLKEKAIWGSKSF